MSRLRKPILLGSAVLAAAGVSLSLLYWGVSLDRFTGGASSLLGGFLDRLPDPAVSKLRWASRDASTLTPVIALLFFAYLLAGSLRALFPGEYDERLLRVVERRRRTYPFPPSYQTTWVQLGLLGTLFSFLLLGGQLKPNLPPDVSVTILVTAFGTALLSTFAGVVGAFLVGPATVAVFWALVVRELVPEEDPSEAVDALKRGLDHLGASAEKASRILVGGSAEEGSDTLARSVEAVTESLESLRQQIALPAIEAWMTRLGTEVAASIHQEQDRRLRRLEDNTYAYLILLGSTVGQGLAQLGRGVESAQRALASDLALRVGEAQRAQADEAKEDRKAFAEGVEELKGEIADLQRKLEKRLGKQQRRWQADLREQAEGIQAALKALLARWRGTSSTSHRPPHPTGASRGRLRRWLGRGL